MTKSKKRREKLEKINLRSMSKQYSHLHTMAKTSVNFQNDWPKTVGGVDERTNGRHADIAPLTQVRQKLN